VLSARGILNTALEFLLGGPEKGGQTRTRKSKKNKKKRRRREG